MTSTARPSRDQSRLNLIDYALMALGSGLAAYTAGMSISRPEVAQFLGIGVVLGTTLSYLIRSFFGNTPVVKVDGILYAAAIVCAVVGFPVLNGMLPEEGFARDVMMAGVLAWMIVLGSALTWRDGTLLFQAIPSVALFGLVGCYDTYIYAPWLFFGFLVCLAIVLARANRREMMRQAVESGYFNRADAPSTPRDFPEQSPELYEDIKRGPWRWQAGPEWALASALLIVLLSGLGAPALQEAAKPITGAVKLLAPPSMRGRPRDGGISQSTSTFVGQGPNRSLSEKTLYIASLDRARYLRTAAYETYTGRGWATTLFSGRVRSGLIGASVAASRAAIGKGAHAVDFSIKSTEPTRQLPLPAETVRLDRSLALIRPDGGGYFLGETLGFVQGTLVESARDSVKALRRVSESDGELLDVHLVPERVRRFAVEAAAGAKDDREAAHRIAEKIAAQVRYNIEAAAVPAGSDPADWFLFTNREGYCDLFATTMTLCARSAGMPARYVIGFLPEKSDGSGNFSVREADYHAWCEVFFEGEGWVVFDATEGASQVEGGERGSSDEQRPWYAASWIAATARAFLVLLALGGGYALLRGIKPAERPPRWEVHRAYAAFERTLRGRIGRRRRPGETIEAYAGEAGAATLGRAFEQALYGPEEPSDEDVKRLRMETRAQKGSRSLGR